MKNSIVTMKDPASDKFSAALFSYEETPSGSIRPLLRVSSKPIFDTAEIAAHHLFNALKPEVRANTDITETKDAG